MKSIFKGKLGTTIILLVTFVLAGVAIFTAIRLYQLRSQPVAPTAPESKPQAAGQLCGGITGATCPAGEVCVYDGGSKQAPYPDASGTCQSSAGKTDVSLCQELTFTLTQVPATATPTATGTPTGTAGATATATATATPTPTGTPNSCGGTCGSNFNCQSDLICSQGFCRNPSCITDTDCVCGTSGATATATTTSMAAATQEASLPDSGTSWPTITGVGLGILVILGSLLLAL